jgi:UDP-N-acetylmuramoyl-tripeptide--D-alanyl-D-alanine ligase
VTGSYGKTSVKFALAELLSQRFNVLATPSSYNTPMGICLVVNNRLRTEHQVLVVEMGMRYRGDIEELCELAPPDIAIVTSVGVAHLETMGSIDRIAKEKSDIIRYMKRDGTVILNADDERVLAMRELAPGAVWTVSAEGNAADIVATDIHYDHEGTSFVVRDETGATAEFKTPLLGQHNVLNILLGVAVGRAMGLRLRQLAHAASRLKPVEHRLELKREGAVTVIDDAFNANPVGAKNAVEVLGGFTGGKRVIVTPGMVELGERQEEENRTFGRHIAKNVDIAILVGRGQTRPIQEGLRDEGFPEERLLVVDSLFEARDYIRAELGAGDVVLYENDLPDQYNETA